MAAVPRGNGVIVGSFIDSAVFQVSPGGVVFGVSRPLVDNDWLDLGNAALAVSENPKDGSLDVITEGIGSSSLPWHRITVGTSETLTTVLKFPAVTK